ncbi:lysM domain-containing protein ARB_00327-like [Cucumis sativus]|uniref:lysM domain-containing protein ARB_00327-like n=1 Tax=Cucumis sativus TaxID=3659 RepID=UPI0012F4D672|nr:lysM domain-containing protein ARB_00327-like [Cucumis sativus]
MAKATISIAIFLLASSLLIFNISVKGEVVVEEASLELQCNKAYGVKSGDTCFAIAQAFKLTTDHFDFINPNLNCSALFVSQWLCVNAFLT